jgi:hypothetical protein
LGAEADTASLLLSTIVSKRPGADGPYGSQSVQTRDKAAAMDEPIQGYRWITVRDCQGFLWAMYAEYEGLAFASFEGKLSSLNLHEIPGASDCEIASLPYEDNDPASDYWAIPINEITIKMLKAKLSAPKVLGENGIVVHTKLATERQLILSACDNFHKDCVRVSTSVPVPLLEELLRRGVLKHI